MKLPSRQRGLTLWGAIFVFGTLAFVALCVIKIGPLYLNEASVRKAVADVASKEGSVDGNVDVATIRSSLQKRWDIDYLSQLQPQDVKVIRNGNALFLAYDYEARVALFGNISVVVHFAHQSPLRAQAG
jgi:hypothetical protein